MVKILSLQVSLERGLPTHGQIQTGSLGVAG
ncbi:MAG: hypothetical protein RL520_1142 [Pseudomonadota bacterium]|jgi:hypothetical protein